MFTVFPSSTSNFTSNFTSNLARLLLSALLLASAAGLASGAEKRLRVEALVLDSAKAVHPEDGAKIKFVYDKDAAQIAAEAMSSIGNAVDHNTTRSNRRTASAGSHETTRSNRGNVVVGSEAFALACELHCESGGWRIEVSESLASNDAVLGFQPQDTIYTLGADLYQPGDHYITHATAADGYFVNYPGEAPTAIVGPVYERYGPSPQPSSVYTPPIDDGGISFCNPDPATGAAPLTSLLDILEIEGIADTETLPLSCEDHTGIEAYAKDPNAGTPGEARGAIEYMLAVSILPASRVAHDTTPWPFELRPIRMELNTATESGDMTLRPLDIRPDLLESSNGGHPTTKEACEAAGGVWKCDPEMTSCFCFLPIKTGRSLSGGDGGDDDAQLTNSEIATRGGDNDPRYWKTRSGSSPNNDPIPGIDIIVEKDTEDNPAAGSGTNNDPIPGIDIIVEKDPEDYGASSSPPNQPPGGQCAPGAGPTVDGRNNSGSAGLPGSVKNAVYPGWPCKWYVPEW